MKWRIQNQALISLIRYLKNCGGIDNPCKINLPLDHEPHWNRNTSNVTNSNFPAYNEDKDGFDLREWWNDLWDGDDDDDGMTIGMTIRS